MKKTNSIIKKYFSCSNKHSIILKKSTLKNPKLSLIRLKKNFKINYVNKTLSVFKICEYLFKNSI